MVSMRKRRLQSLSTPAASDGTHARIRETTRVRNPHDLSDNVRSDLSLEMSSPDHEAEEAYASRSEDPVTPACPVQETARRTPLDQMEARVMFMSSILARSRPAEVWLRPQRKPNNVSMELLPSTELELGHAIAALPTMLGAGDEISHEDDDTGDDPVVSKGEEQDPPVIASSGESSDCSLETRYLDSWCKSPSVSSRRRARRAAFQRWNSTISPECLTIHRETDTASPPLTKYYTRNPSRRARRNVDIVEAFAPAAGSRGHNRRTCNANDDPQEGDEAPEEQPLLHPLTDVKQYQESQAQGKHIARSYHCRNLSSASPEEEEKKSRSKGEPGMDGREKYCSKGAQGRVFMSSVRDCSLGGRYSLMALQDKIEEEHGIQEGARRCALMASLRRKKPWQCPFMAMEGHKLCERHFHRAKVTRLKARKASRKAKSMKESNFG